MTEASATAVSEVTSKASPSARRMRAVYAPYTRRIRDSAIPRVTSFDGWKGKPPISQLTSSRSRRIPYALAGACAINLTRPSQGTVRACCFARRSGWRRALVGRTSAWNGHLRGEWSVHRLG